MTPAPILVVLVPCMDTVKSHFAFDLCNLFDHLHRHPVVDPRLMIHQSSILPLSRCILVREALKVPAEWVLFLDSDMRFPGDIVHRLMAHHLDVVACQYAKKDGKQSPVIKYESKQELEGVLQVESVATGCLLIKASVFAKLRKPYFAFVSSAEPMVEGEPDSMCYGEDVYFSKMCNQAGVPMYCDFEASKHIGHTGQACFKLDGVKFGGDS